MDLDGPMILTAVLVLVVSYPYEYEYDECICSTVRYSMLAYPCWTMRAGGPYINWWGWALSLLYTVAAATPSHLLRALLALSPPARVDGGDGDRGGDGGGFRVLVRVQYQ